MQLGSLIMHLNLKINTIGNKNYYLAGQLKEKAEETMAPGANL